MLPAMGCQLNMPRSIPRTTMGRTHNERANGRCRHRGQCIEHSTLQGSSNQHDPALTSEVSGPRISRQPTSVVALTVPLRR